MGEEGTEGPTGPLGRKLEELRAGSELQGSGAGGGRALRHPAEPGAPHLNCWAL